MPVIQKPIPPPSPARLPLAPEARAPHPALVALSTQPRPAPAPLDFATLRQLALDAGADDVGAVSLDDPRVQSERAPVLAAMPGARTLVSLVLRMHKDNLRSPQRSVANLEFQNRGHDADEVARALAVALSARGHPTINPAMAFPMEMEAFPARTWIVSHKVVATAAGLGVMGLHRNLIHERFGSHILLATVVTSAELAHRADTLATNPCIDCKLCVAACPVGAIETDGAFRFSACYDHNYREFMSGFADVVEAVAESDGRAALRQTLSQGDLAKTWQSLAYKPTYNAAYCLAVCPAGSEVLAPFVDDRAGFLRDVLKPLTQKEETLYAVRGSDAAAHAQKRFPHKRLRIVRSSLRPTSLEGFFSGLPLTFQRGPARGWRALFHFELEAAQPAGAVREAHVIVDDGTLRVVDGAPTEADPTLPRVHVRGDGATWLGVVAGEKSAVWAVITRRLRIDGSKKLLDRFAACFPR